jgi:hypothetical protein
MTGIGSDIGGGVTRSSRVRCAKKAKRPAGSTKPSKGPVNIGGGSIVKSSGSSRPSDKSKPGRKTK